VYIRCICIILRPTRVVNYVLTSAIAKRTRIDVRVTHTIVIEKQNTSQKRDRRRILDDVFLSTRVHYTAYYVYIIL